MVDRMTCYKTSGEEEDKEQKMTSFYFFPDGSKFSNSAYQAHHSKRFAPVPVSVL
jgi:hypothetical protein